MRLVKGSHIVVPRIHDKRYAYILQNPDRRVVFLIPYEREFTLIGTTDVQVARARTCRPAISPDEIAYLCAAASRYSARAVTPDQVVWSYSGVRPLYDDGKADPSAITRDYVLLLDEKRSAAAVGVRRQDHHLPQARRACDGEARALDSGTPALDRMPRRCRAAISAGAIFDGLLAEFRARYPELRSALAGAPAAPPRHAEREDSRRTRKREADLGENFGGGLYERELAYLMPSTNGRAAATTCCGGAPSAACT